MMLIKAYIFVTKAAPAAYYEISNVWQIKAIRIINNKTGKQIIS